MCRNVHVREHIREEGVRIKGPEDLLKYVCIFGFNHKCTCGGREVRNEDVDGKESRHTSGVMRTNEYINRHRDIGVY